MIPILILAPGPALRAGLRALLSAESDLHILAVAPGLAELEDTPEARVVVAAEGSLTGSLRPDWSILLVGESADEARALAAAGLRAWGMVSLDAPAEALSAAVRALDQGLVAAPPELLEAIFSTPAAQAAWPLEPAEPELPTERLTPREVDVLRALAEGFTNRQIAARLGVSEHTVKFHVSSIYSKLNVSNRAEATRMGARRGYLSI